MIVNFYVHIFFTKNVTVNIKHINIVKICVKFVLRWITVIFYYCKNGEQFSFTKRVIKNYVLFLPRWTLRFLIFFLFFVFLLLSNTCNKSINIVQQLSFWNIHQYKFHNTRFTSFLIYDLRCPVFIGVIRLPSYKSCYCWTIAGMLPWRYL